MDVIDCFSANYAEARQKFLLACQSASAHVDIQVTSIDHPLTGPDGGALATDVATLGDPAAKHVLLLNSGTHGNEGFCGSACLIDWLRQRRYLDLPSNVRVVLSHAINPHGFAHVRRATEDNVDLNRNFLDHSAPHPVNADYPAIHDLLIPKEWTGKARAEADAGLEAFAAEHGAFALQAAISRGQYSHPDGMFFGGQAPTWSNSTFRHILRTFVAPATLVGFIDYHTGLGPYGWPELIAESAPGQPPYDRALAWYGHGITSSDDGSSASPSLAGTIKGALIQELPDAEEVTVAAEFGTREVKRVINGLRGDHWLHNNPSADPALARDIKAAIRDGLYPDEDDWKEMVALRSRQFLTRAVRGLAEGI
jgi:hypothetical protein